MRVCLAAGAAVAACGLAATAVAHAGGLTLPARGVRTLARGGAFVAGADDADALFQNPAGLAHGAGDGKRTLLFDAAFVYQTVEHTRLDATGAALPPVTNQQPGQLAPSLAGSLGIGDRLVIAGGVAAPYAGTHRYADSGAQRYAALSMAGSTIVTVAIGAAYRVTDRLRIGATLQDTVSHLDARFVVTGCPDEACAPEDPGFDAELRVRQTDYVAPGASLGIQYDATPSLTIGAMAQSPARVSAPGSLAIELPATAVFERATVAGDTASIEFTLPPVIRAGVELRPTRALRVEAALDIELWSLHDRLTVTPDGVAIDGVAGAAGPIALGRIAIPREYGTSFSPSIGVEWHGPKLMLGAGYAYETAAAPAAYVSAMAVDASKHVIGLGGGYEADGWQIGAAVGAALLADVDLALADAAVLQQAPFRGAPSELRANAGSYRSRYLVGGLRFARRW